VQVWVTTGDQSKLLSRQADVSFSYDVPSPIPTIDVDEARSYQQMIGFGTLPAASVVTFNWN
jgi:glucosylceramidase